MAKYVTTTIVAALLIFTQLANAQKVLNQTETHWVNEAKTELTRALSDMDMSEEERIGIIEKSARTLKEYGQPPAYPTGKIPVAEMMDMNFELCKRNITELNDWWLKLKQISKDEKIKLINAMQIEVTEKQIELIIPGGNGAVQLSQEAIGNVFGWNTVEGLNTGETNDANELAKWFKTLVERNELTEKISLLVNDEKESLKKINEDRTKFKITEAKLRQKYKMAEMTTQTMQGYAGAKTAETGSPKTTASAGISANSETNLKKVQPINVLIGTWRFGFSDSGYFYWTFNNDGSFVFQDKMNEGSEDRTGKYIVEGNTLSLYNSDGCEKILGKYPFRLIDNEIHFNNIDDKCVERHLTLNHIWSK